MSSDTPAGAGMVGDGTAPAPAAPPTASESEHASRATGKVAKAAATTADADAGEATPHYNKDGLHYVWGAYTFSQYVYKFFDHLDSDTKVDREAMCDRLSDIGGHRAAGLRGAALAATTDWSNKLKTVAERPDEDHSYGVWRGLPRVPQFPIAEDGEGAYAVSLMFPGLEPDGSKSCVAMFSNTSRREVFVSFRGTVTLRDTIDDIKGWTDPTGASQGAVHATFMARAKRFPLQTLCSLLGKEDPWTIVLCGHSLGGAVAALVTARLLDEIAADGAYSASMGLVKCITFGCPLVGDSAFAHRFAARQYDGVFTHFVNKRDIIVRAPVMGGIAVDAMANAIVERAPAVLGVAAAGIGGPLAGAAASAIASALPTVKDVLMESFPVVPKYYPLGSFFALHVGSDQTGGGASLDVGVGAAVPPPAAGPPGPGRSISSASGAPETKTGEDDTSEPGATVTRVVAPGGVDPVAFARPSPRHAQRSPRVDALSMGDSRAVASTFLEEIKGGLTLGDLQSHRLGVYGIALEHHLPRRNVGKFERRAACSIKLDLRYMPRQGLDPTAGADNVALLRLRNSASEKGSCSCVITGAGMDFVREARLEWNRDVQLTVVERSDQHLSASTVGRAFALETGRQLSEVGPPPKDTPARVELLPMWLMPRELWERGLPVELPLHVYRPVMTRTERQDRCAEDHVLAAVAILDSLHRPTKLHRARDRDSVTRGLAVDQAAEGDDLKQRWKKMYTELEPVWQRSALGRVEDLSTLDESAQMARSHAVLARYLALRKCLAKPVPGTRVLELCNATEKGNLAAELKDELDNIDRSDDELDACRDGLEAAVRALESGGVVHSSQPADGAAASGAGADRTPGLPALLLTKEDWNNAKRGIGDTGVPAAERARAIQSMSASVSYMVVAMVARPIRLTKLKGVFKVSAGLFGLVVLPTLGAAVAVGAAAEAVGASGVALSYLAGNLLAFGAAAGGGASMALAAKVGLRMLTTIDSQASINSQAYSRRAKDLLVQLDLSGKENEKRRHLRDSKTATVGDLERAVEGVLDRALADQEGNMGSALSGRNLTKTGEVYDRSVAPKVDSGFLWAWSASSLDDQSKLSALQTVHAFMHTARLRRLVYQIPTILVIGAKGVGKTAAVKSILGLHNDAYSADLDVPALFHANYEPDARRPSYVDIIDFVADDDLMWRPVLNTLLHVAAGVIVVTSLDPEENQRTHHLQLVAAVAGALASIHTTYTDNVLVLVNKLDESHDELTALFAASRRGEHADGSSDTGGGAASSGPASTAASTASIAEGITAEDRAKADRRLVLEVQDMASCVSMQGQRARNLVVWPTALGAEDTSGCQSALAGARRRGSLSTGMVPPLPRSGGAAAAATAAAGTGDASPVRDSARQTSLGLRFGDDVQRWVQARARQHCRSR